MYYNLLIIYVLVVLNMSLLQHWKMGVKYRRLSRLAEILADIGLPHRNNKQKELKCQ